jgi:GT2 family glycosyltransferase
MINDGTGFGPNVNRGLVLATGEFIAVAGNDTWVVGGDVSDLCLAETVTSPLVIGDVPGIAPPLEPEGFHGCFWVAPRSVLNRVGLLDERFEHGFYEDNDFVARLRESNIETRLVRSVRVRHVGGLTMLKLGTQPREWLARNEQIFREKWGWTPSPTVIFRSLRNGETWHYCRNCPDWPDQHYVEQAEIPEGPQCVRCRSIWDAGQCRLGTGGGADA